MLRWELGHVDSTILTCPVHIMRDAWCPIRIQDSEGLAGLNEKRMGVDFLTFIPGLSGQIM